MDKLSPDNVEQFYNVLRAWRGRRVLGLFLFKVLEYFATA